MKAEPAHQIRLLDLQDIDTVIDRLRHRARNLPENVELEELDAEIARLNDAAAQTAAELKDLDREQRKAESDVDQVRTREERDGKRLEAGQVSSPKELESLQSEIASLRRRRAELEDIVLGVMERREGVEAKQAADAEALTVGQEKRVEAERRQKAALEEISVEERDAGERRAKLRGDLPQDLLTLYDKLRDSYGGVGAAALRQGRCEGCKLALSTAEVSQIRSAPAEEVVRCEECRRILVRTPESGL
ncbi:hypothetical protein J4H86_00460 [Spiractinospora alimapuensis]|uniref:zinc ribbon domain-containing protein n=1 Tax=Spiractinospora alimapuensis TaxID=2820884 RepID=UPI001F3887ED|nr:C4-type zinc ribbon domain-containing protein [Spiractinospora alimapuensis]QVQ52381.1 hypothetical protein J4H86_00460 [Spiractinospora alimapuensis]